MLSTKVVLAVLVLLSSSSAGSSLQSSGGKSEATSSDDVNVDWVNQRTPAIHVFVGPTPAEYMKAIDENKDILRARVLLDSSTIVEFHERPKNIDFYDSTIFVNRRGKLSGATTLEK